MTRSPKKVGAALSGKKTWSQNVLRGFHSAFIGRQNIQKAAQWLTPLVILEKQLEGDS